MPPGRSYFLIGRKIKLAISTRALREWAAAKAGLPDWLLDESYDAVGDLAETLALILPPAEASSSLPLAQLVAERIVPLPKLAPEEQRRLIEQTWRELDVRQRLVWHKLITGEFRVGVARTLVARALAAVAGVTSATMAHRLMGHWQPTATDYAELLAGETAPPTPRGRTPSFWPIRWKATRRAWETSPIGNWNGNGTASARS